MTYITSQMLLQQFGVIYKKPTIHEIAEQINLLQELHKATLMPKWKC